MNCHDIDRLLIAGTDLPAWPIEARAHGQSCERCRDLQGLGFGNQSSRFGSVVSASVPRVVSEAVLGDLRPVTFLPGDITLTLVVVAAVVATMGILLAIVGAAGFPAMSNFQRIVFGFVLIGMVLATAFGYVKRLVPGSLIIIPQWTVLAVLSGLFALLVGWQFHHSYDLPMSKANLACFECGLFGAGLAFLAGWLLGKRGLWGVPAVEALCLLSAVAALLMLTIHCPVQNAGHVLIGHGGAFLTAMVAGLAARWYGSRSH